MSATALRLPARLHTFLSRHQLSTFVKLTPALLFVSAKMSGFLHHQLEPVHCGLANLFHNLMWYRHYHNPKRDHYSMGAIQYPLQQESLVENTLR